MPAAQASSAGIVIEVSAEQGGAGPLKALARNRPPALRCRERPSLALRVLGEEPSRCFDGPHLPRDEYTAPVIPAGRTGTRLFLFSECSGTPTLRNIRVHI